MCISEKMNFPKGVIETRIFEIRGDLSLLVEVVETGEQHEVLPLLESQKKGRRSYERIVEESREGDPLLIYILKGEGMDNIRIAFDAMREL